jgi:transposase
MNTSREEQRQAQARERARVILQVQRGELTAVEGAKQLGMSRKSYYQWEQRGLAGMLSELQEQEPGRPEKESDPEREALERKIADLEQQLAVASQTAEVRAMLLAMDEVKQRRERREKGGAKKKPPHSPQSWPGPKTSKKPPASAPGGCAPP